MVRVLPVLVLLLCMAVLLVVKPQIILRLSAHLWYRLVLRRDNMARVPEWAAHYLWAAPGDPIPGRITVLEDSVRMLAAIVLASPIGLTVVILLTGE